MISHSVDPYWTEEGDPSKAYLLFDLIPDAVLLGWSDEKIEAKVLLHPSVRLAMPLEKARGNVPKVYRFEEQMLLPFSLPPS